MYLITVIKLSLNIALNRKKYDYIILPKKKNSKKFAFHDAIPLEVCKHISSTARPLKICRSTQIQDLMNSSIIIRIEKIYIMHYKRT